MTNMSTPIAAETPSEPAHGREAVDAFLEWIGDDLFRVAFKRDDEGIWYALALDFDVTGRGTTLRSALEELLELVIVYLESFHAEGEPIEAARRRVPLSIRAQVAVGSTVARLSHGLNHRPPKSGRTDVLPTSSAVEHALIAC